MTFYRPCPTPQRRGMSSIAKAMGMVGITNPVIKTIVATHSAENIDVSITTVLGTAVA